MIECPHCHTRVLPAAAGRCPACGKNVYEREGLDLTQTSMSVREKAALPALCYRCGSPTGRRVTIRRQWQASGDSWIVRAILFVLAPFWTLFWLLLRYRPGWSVQVRLPQCGPCAKFGTPDPQHVDFGAGEMTFIVHKDFRAATAALGKPASPRSAR